jgi:hypothetical protein
VKSHADNLQLQTVWGRAITKPHASTAAYTAWLPSNADKPQLQKVRNAKQHLLIMAGITTTAVMKPHATTAAYKAHFLVLCTANVGNTLAEKLLLQLIMMLHEHEEMFTA